MELGHRKKVWQEEAREERSKEERQYFLELLNQDLTKEEIKEKLQQGMR